MTTSRQTGFTLIEIMIVVAILAIISAIAIPLYLGHIREARFSAALDDIRQMQLILDDLAGDDNLAALDADSEEERGVYRVTANGAIVLDAVGAAPAGSEPWLDPWGRIYRYRRADDTSQDYVLFSQGADSGDPADDVSK
jgi:prepilin-type N-terminal cleavage/methylation domain-containing protein